ncbi:hypothetical protein M3Y98_00547300 [Aphelenchoides besseyi]|nr:hypothetical protein M3Y98_00547300 [Aphelenchoides besseyi]
MDKKRKSSCPPFARLKYWMHKPKPWREPVDSDPNVAVHRLNMEIRKIKCLNGSQALFASPSVQRKKLQFKRNAQKPPFLLRSMEKGWNSWTKYERKCQQFAISRSQSAPTIVEDKELESNPPIVSFPLSEDGDDKHADTDPEIENRSHPLPNSDVNVQFLRTPAVEGLRRWRDVTLDISPIQKPSTSGLRQQTTKQIFHSTPNPTQRRPLKRASQPLSFSSPPTRTKRPAAGNREAPLSQRKR